MFRSSQPKFVSMLYKFLFSTFFFFHVLVFFLHAAFFKTAVRGDILTLDHKFHSVLLAGRRQKCAPCKTPAPTNPV